MLVSTNWRWLTFDCIGAGALRVHKQMRTKAIAQPVLLVGLHLLVSAKSVTLAKHLLPMAAGARCVLPLAAPLLSVQPMLHASPRSLQCTH